MDFFDFTYFQKYDFLSNNSMEPEHMITLEYEKLNILQKGQCYSIRTKLLNV